MTSTPLQAALRARRVAVDRAQRLRRRGATKRLSAAHPQQRADWIRLAARTAEVHAQLLACGPSPGVTPLWADYERALARRLLPVPPAAFLREPLLLETMLVRGARLQRRELAWLRGQFDPERLALLLAEDPTGDPALSKSEPPTSHTAIHHLFHLERFAAVAGRPAGDAPVIVEWGGGFGGFARTLRRTATADPPAHVIVDLPLMAALQWTYLSTVLGEDQVQLVTAPGQRPTPGVVSIVPATLGLSVDVKADLFVSLWGLSETNAELQDAVAATDFFGAEHLLLAFQRDGPSTPDAARVGSLAQKAGGHVEPVGVLSHSSYGLR